MSGEATLRGDETFTPPPVTVRVAPMLRIQGYSDLSRVRPVIKDVAQRMASVAEQSFNPAVRYRHLKVLSCVEGTLALETGTDLHCPAFAHFLPECREVVVFVLTIGRDFDRRLEDLLQRGKTLEALFLESAGWLGVETVTKRLTEHLRRTSARRGLRLTRRIAPGYTYRIGDTTTEWELREQEPLFGLFEGDNLPVRLLDSCAMLPKMSRSGMFGLRPRD